MHLPKLQQLVETLSVSNNKDIICEGVIQDLFKKLPGVGKFLEIAKQHKAELLDILKTSKSAKEVKQKLDQLANKIATKPVTEGWKTSLLGGLGAGSASVLSSMWMNSMGFIDGVLQKAAEGDVGGAAAAGSYMALIPVMFMLLAATLLFKSAKQSDKENEKEAKEFYGKQ